MARSKTSKPLRRLATITAAAGMLVLSSGVALMVTATPANAANKVGICHATNSDSNPYVFISVDDDSVKLKGHLKHRSAPNKHWKSDGTFNGDAHEDGDAKPDLIGSFTDDEGVFHEYDGVITEASCEDTVVPDADVATAEVEYTEPTCENDNLATFEVTLDNATFSFTGDNTAGGTVTVTATATGTALFEETGTNTLVFDPHTYDDAKDLEGEECGVTTPPTETPNPPVVEPPTSVPTVVHAGLVDDIASATNTGSQGLALLIAGLVLMVIAGGFGVAGPIGRARS